MLIIGCDLHTRYQVIAMLNSETGELVTRRLQHENGEAGAFYASLPCSGAGGDRGDRLYTMVRAADGGVEL